MVYGNFIYKLSPIRRRGNVMIAEWSACEPTYFDLVDGAGIYLRNVG
jgi:hypothetical protein